MVDRSRASTETSLRVGSILLTDLAEALASPGATSKRLAVVGGALTLVDADAQEEPIGGGGGGFFGASGPAIVTPSVGTPELVIGEFTLVGSATFGDPGDPEVLLPSSLAGGLTPFESVAYTLIAMGGSDAGEVATVTPQGDDVFLIATNEFRKEDVAIAWVFLGRDVLAPGGNWYGFRLESNALVRSATANLGTVNGAVSLNNAEAYAHEMVIDGNVTITFDGAGAAQGAGARGRVFIKQDGIGGHTVTWPGNFNWPAATPPVQTPAANATDIYEIQLIGGNALIFAHRVAADLR
jgi:hypothetical protein